jgi:hypothetical protein
VLCCRLTMKSGPRNTPAPTSSISMFYISQLCNKPATSSMRNIALARGDTCCKIKNDDVQCVRGVGGVSEDHGSPRCCQVQSTPPNSKHWATRNKFKRIWVGSILKLHHIRCCTCLLRNTLRAFFGKCSLNFLMLRKCGGEIAGEERATKMSWGRC